MRAPGRRPPAGAERVGPAPGEGPAQEQREAPAEVGPWPMWVLGGAFLVDAIDQNVIRGLVPQLKHAFGVGDFAIGVLMSAFVVVNGLVTLPAGYLADRWHRTRVAGGAVAAWSVVSAAGSLAPTFGVLTVLRGALGFGQGITDPSASSLIPDYYVLERRGRAFSVQQSLTFAGTGLGVLAGGIVGTTLGWRPALVVASVPGLVVAVALFRLREPVRGAADRVRVGAATEVAYVEPATPRQPLFAEGVGSFVRDLGRGLRRDIGVILGIPTLRFALVGVSALLFVVTAVASWMTEFYQRQLGTTQVEATTAFLVLALAGGIPGVLAGGRVADRWTHRVEGARVVIPGIALIIATSLFLVSMIPMPFTVCLGVQLVAFFFATSAIPALRAGLTDAVPASLRGTGFGTFNLASVLFGTAAAPLITAALSQYFGDNLRTAFLIELPFAYVGAGLLLAARRHLEEDTRRILAVVAEAMEEAP